MEKAISSDFVFLKYKEKNHPQNNIYNKLSILSKKEKAKMGEGRINEEFGINGYTLLCVK